ncbi:MAG: hypothetical protein WAU07_03790 [Microgenomates group bacterium]
MSLKYHSILASVFSVCKKIVLITFCLLLLVNPVSAAEGINEQIHFQGKVVNLDGTNVADGDYAFEFKIYTVSTAGTAVWTETRSGGDVVEVTDGIFSVNLGSVTALPGSVDFNSDSLYLSVNFDGDGEMSPRIRLTAVPYAHNAAKVSGLTVTDTTGTLTIPDGTVIEFSGANNLTFITSGASSVTLPTTGTLATLAGTEELTNKTIGSTGLVFSGATTDIDTAAAEGIAIQGRAASSFNTTSGAISFQAAGTGTISTIQIGAGGSGSTTPDYFALDVKSDTGDPAGGAEGYMYYNSFDNVFRCYQNSGWINCIGAGGAQTPWTSDIDADGYDLTALSNLEFDETTGAPAGTVVGAYRDNSGDLNLNVLTSKALNVQVNGSDEYTFSSTIFDASSNTIQTTGSVLGNSIDRTTAGALTIGNTTATSVSICNSTDCDTITIGTNTDADTITIGDSLDGLTIASTAFSVNSSGAVSGITTLATSGDWVWSATTPTITINAAETFSVGPSGGDTFVVNSSGSLMSFLDGSGNGFVFDADTGPLYSGTARIARKYTLSPEYSGAVVTGDGSNNSGTLTSDFCEQGASADIPNTNTTICNTSGDIHNYYHWTTTQGTAQDYDIWVRWRVPENFAAWDTNPVQVYAKRTDATNNAVTVYVHDTGGTLNNAGGTQAAGTSWTQTAVALTGGTWTPGSYVTFRIVLTADTGGDSVQVGEINLNYLSNN